MSGSLRNLSELVSAAAATHPDKPALRHGEQVTTWAELDAGVAATAGALLGLGLDRGDRVALVLGNRPEFVTTFFAVARAGLVAVPVNTGYTTGELTRQLADCGARAALCEPETAERVLAAQGQCGQLAHLLCTDATGHDLPVLAELLAGAEPAPAPTAGAEDLAVLLYTSGTSGQPRGAMLSHRALLANLDQLSRIDPPVVTADDVVLLVLPLFHVYGLNAALGMVAKMGATGVLVERFDPVETLELVRRHRVTNLVGAPPMYVAWSMLPAADEAMQTVRLAVSGAAPLPPEVFDTMREATGRPVYEGYGLTETAPVLTTTLMSDEPRPGAIGRPIPGVELRLLDDDGDEPEPGDPGEVVVRGANLFSGYWPDRADGPDSDGWWPTGDLAYLDEHHDLRIAGRRRELVLVSGFNVYPVEVEQVLQAHPDIEEAAVVGIPHPYTGETVKAYVVLRPGARLTADEVIDHTADQLARFKCPTAVEFVDELPHTTAGKVAKGRLRERERPAVA